MTKNRLRGNRSDGITRKPRWVLARSYEEVQTYARQSRTPIKNLRFIDGPHRIRQEIPLNTEFELIKTGTWFLIERTKLKEIIHELKLRNNWSGESF